MRFSSILLPLPYAFPFPLPLQVWGGLLLTPSPPLCLPRTPRTKTSLGPQVTTHSHQRRGPGGDPGHSWPQTQTSGRCFPSPLLSSLRIPPELSLGHQDERAPLIPSLPQQVSLNSQSFGCTTGSPGTEITRSVRPLVRPGVSEGPAYPVMAPRRPAVETLPCRPTQALHGGVV